MRRLARPLLYAGVLGVVLGLAKAHAVWIGHYDFTGSSRFAWTIVYAALLSVTAYGFGLPDLPRTKQAMLSASVAAAFVGALAMSIVQLLVGDALLPRFVVFGSALLLPDWYRICVGLSVGGRAHDEARERVAVIAERDEIAALESELDALPERPASVVVGLTPAEALATPDSPDPLWARLTAVDPSVVVLDRGVQTEPSIVAQVAQLHERGVRVRTLSGFYEGWLGKLPMSELERTSLFFDIGEIHRARYSRVRRLLDVPLALSGAVVLALLIPLVGAANLVGNRGPLFYRQLRVGKGGSEFTILKFRTMRADDSARTDWTSTTDPRVTPLGRLLRATHVDELPQVINILRGDLSVVGPRPEQPRYVRELEEKLPFYRLRHLVRPGLTGWAQVNYGYAGDERDALEKLQYDFWYLRHQSLALDLRIIGRTIRSMGGGR